MSQSEQGSGERKHHIPNWRLVLDDGEGMPYRQCTICGDVVVGNDTDPLAELQSRPTTAEHEALKAERDQSAKKAQARELDLDEAMHVASVWEGKARTAEAENAQLRQERDGLKAKAVDVGAAILMGVPPKDLVVALQQMAQAAINSKDQGGE